MIRIILLLCFGTVCLSPAGSCQQKDSIFFYNGQVLIGEVHAANLGSISIDDIDLKIQSIKLYKIKRLRINERFKIETLDKHLYYGFLQPSPKEGWIRILPEGDSALSVPIVTIHHLIPLEKQFFKRLDGTLSAGLSFTKSSNIGQVNLSATVGFATRLFEYQLQGSEIGSIDSGKFSRDNESLQLFTGFDLTSVWFLAGVIQYQRNLELSISRRYLELLGAGNKLVIKDTWQLLAVSGLTFTQEKSTANVNTVQFEIPLMFRFNFYKFHHPNIQISSSQTAFISLSEQGRVRYDGNTSFSWELIRYFYLTINPYTNFDSKPPSVGSNKFDYGIVVSLSYKF
jgi:hypothetical protein